MQKRGLSDVVTTVLIILLALVAVAIIGGVVIKNINKSAGKFDALSSCQELQIKPTKCDGSTGSVTIERGPDTLTVSNIKLVLEDSSGTVKSYDVLNPSTNVPKPYQTSVVFPATTPTGTPIKIASIAPVVRGTDGVDTPCRVVDVKVSCSLSYVLTITTTEDLQMQDPTHPTPDGPPECTQSTSPCTFTYPQTQNAVVILHGGGYGWGGDCASFGNGPTCTLTMNQNRLADLSA